MSLLLVTSLGRELALSPHSSLLNVPLLSSWSGFILDPFGKCWCEGRAQDVLCIATVVFIPAWSPEAGLELGLGMGKCVVIPSLSPDYKKT